MKRNISNKLLFSFTGLLLLVLTSCSVTSNYTALSSKNIAKFDQKNASGAEVLEGEKCAVIILGMLFGSLALDKAVEDAVSNSKQGATALVDAEVYGGGTIVLGFGSYCTKVKGFGVKNI